jgi:hypothetical protein
MEALAAMVAYNGGKPLTCLALSLSVDVRSSRRFYLRVTLRPLVTTPGASGR